LIIDVIYVQTLVVIYILIIFVFFLLTSIDKVDWWIILPYTTMIEILVLEDQKTLWDFLGVRHSFLVYQRKRLFYCKLQILLYQVLYIFGVIHPMIYR
jgi:hypothetical protein